MEIFMKKLFLLLLLLLAACGGETAVNEEITGEETAVSIPNTPAPVEVETVSEEIVPIAAKPQLVEFYADW